MTKVLWTPASGPAITFETGPDAAVRMKTLRGFGPVTISPYTTQAPGQEGVTALDVTVPARRPVIQAALRTVDAAALWDLRRDIAKAFTNHPVRFGESLELGLLRVERDDDLDPLEIDALAISAVTDRTKAPGIGTVDAEWFCPYPHFRDVEDSTIASIAVDDSEIAANDGDVDAPFVAKIYGPATEVTLTNETTGEVLTVTVALASGSEWLQVETTPGGKKVRKYTSPTAWTNAIAGLSTSEGQLFQLRPGNNSIKLEAVGDSGATHAALTWRNRYSGI